MSRRTKGAFAAMVAAMVLLVSACQTGRQQDGEGAPADTAGMEQDTAMQDTTMQDTADTGAMEP